MITYERAINSRTAAAPVERCLTTTGNVHAEGVSLHSPGSHSAPWVFDPPFIAPRSGATSRVAPLCGEDLRCGWYPGCAARPRALELDRVAVGETPRRPPPNSLPEREGDGGAATCCTTPSTRGPLVRRNAHSLKPLQATRCSNSQHDAPDSKTRRGGAGSDGKRAMSDERRVMSDELSKKSEDGSQSTAVGRVRRYP
jgi:hypothetical protein